MKKLLLLLMLSLSIAAAEQNESLSRGGMPFSIPEKVTVHMGETFTIVKHGKHGKLLSLEPLKLVSCSWPLELIKYEYFGFDSGGQPGSVKYVWTFKVANRNPGINLCWYVMHKALVFKSSEGLDHIIDVEVINK